MKNQYNCHNSYIVYIQYVVLPSSDQEIIPVNAEFGILRKLPGTSAMRKCYQLLL